MTEQTEKIQAATKTDVTLEQMRKLSRRVGEVIDLMRGQRDSLRKRGVNLPPGSLDGLRTLKARIDTLSKQLGNSSLELKQLRALAETTAVVNSSQTTDEVLNQVIDTVIKLTGAERGYIVLKNPETGELEFKIARGMDEEQLDSKDEFVVSKTIINRVADTGEAVLADNASEDERWEDQKSVVGFQLRSILAVPLKRKDRVIGGVYCDNRIRAGLFKQHELDLLTAFAHQAAVAIENAHLFEAVRAQLNEVKELRSKLESIFTSIASGVITVDADDMILVCNEAASHIMDTQDAIGKNLKEVLPSSVDAAFYDILERVRSGSAEENLEIEPESEDADKRYWRLIASPLRGAKGVSQGVAVVMDDLTEEKEHEAKYKELKLYLPEALTKDIKSIDELGLGGQERDISAFSADVRGFTSFSERLEPEELMEVINEYLKIASDSINLFDGIVDSYLGDAVTGLFNTQLNPQDDHPSRAVHAGMQLMLDLRALHEILPEEQRLFFGIGIHTGMAVLGNVGSETRKEFAALGDAVEISKFMEGNAGPGQVVISQATYKQVKHAFECELTPVIRPKKGFEDFTTLYRVIKKKKGAGTGPMIFDPELAELLDGLKGEL